jgi:hypothetical protein
MVLQRKFDTIRTSCFIIPSTKEVHMIPVIKVWNLPKMEEEQLIKLYKEIIAAVVRVKELGLKDENDMTVLFPKDMMSYGLEKKIVIEVTGLLADPEITDVTRGILNALLLDAVSREIPTARFLECFVADFVDPEDIGVIQFIPNQTTPCNREPDEGLDDIVEKITGPLHH